MAATDASALPLMAGVRPHHTDRRIANLARLTCLAAITAFYIWTFRLPVTQLDDAFISYRYALNLVNGHGLVFNPGAYVEGYTNLLWTLLIASGIWLGGEAEAIGHWLSVIFAAATMLTSYAYAVRLLGQTSRWLALLAPLGLLTANAFVCWTTAGLETPLFGWLAISAALALSHRRRYAAALLCVLAMMTRPEGALLAACLLLYDGCSHLAAWRGASFRERIADAAGPALLFAGGLAALTLFRLWYYGDVVPNTFYAKVGGIPVSRGVFYLRNALVDGPGLLLPGVIVAAVTVPRFRPAAVFILCNAIYIVAIGGDVFPLGRFLLPALPMMLGGAIAGGGYMLRQSAAAGLALLALLPACMAWSLYGTWPPGWGPPDYDFAHVRAAQWPHSAKRTEARIHWIFVPDEDARKHRQIANLQQLRPPAHVLALIGIGKLGYWGKDFVILDMVGLTDRHIARSGKSIAGSFIAPGHSRTDAAYVLSRRPDVIEMPKRGSATLNLPAIIDMWAQPDLERLYHFDPAVNAYVRN
jgi:arabinofuranosyltransferase